MENQIDQSEHLRLSVAPYTLVNSDLHASSQDPSLQAVAFLNEVMDRYPNAISFAPGAPYPNFLDVIDIGSLIEVYSSHLGTQRGISPSQIGRCLFEYGPSRGQICDLVAQYLDLDFGIHTDPESIVITVGCQEAIFLALRALRSGPQDVLAVVTPCYMGVIGAARCLDFEVASIDEGIAGIDLDSVNAVCDACRRSGKKLRAIYIAPDFANPSGVQMDLCTRIKLLALAERHDFLLLEDSTYSFTAMSDNILPSLKKLDNGRRVIYLGTFSKVCAPGARVGFIVADQIVHDRSIRGSRLASYLAGLKTMITVNTAPICQAIIGGMLLAHDCSLKTLVAERARLYKENRDRLLIFLDARLGGQKGVQWNSPRGGFFVRMRLPFQIDEKLVHFCAEKFGVIWTPMAYFYPYAISSDELRLSCSYLTHEQIDEGTRRLATFVQSTCASIS